MRLLREKAYLQTDGYYLGVCWSDNEPRVVLHASDDVYFYPVRDIWCRLFAPLQDNKESASPSLGHVCTLLCGHDGAVQYAVDVMVPSRMGVDGPWVVYVCYF